MGLFSKKKQSKPRIAGEVTLEDGETVTVNSIIDCIGDSCPRPQLMTRSALSKAESGDILAVDVDNPTSMEALPPIIVENSGTHLGTIRQSRHWAVVMRKN